MAQVPNILLIGASGYVGSYLQTRLAADGYRIDTCDMGVRGHPLGRPTFEKDYAALDHETLQPYSHVVWFAGHASVGAATADPQAALHNNVLNLVALRERLPPSCRLIYASTGSLYSVPTSASGAVDPSRETDRIVATTNAYDISKFCFDYIAEGFLQNVVGLRLGTVCGASPNLRPELVFNAMNLAAARTGVVAVANPGVWRSLLFLDDLYASVAACIEHPALGRQIFNLASAAIRIGDLAEIVAGVHGATIEHRGESATYSFRLDTRCAQTTLGIAFRADLEARCAEFAAAVGGQWAAAS